jgi:hypothetical protein
VNQVELRGGFFVTLIIEQKTDRKITKTKNIGKISYCS